MSKHTPGPWNSPKWHCSDEDAEQSRKLLGREPPPALTNEGQRYVMAGEGDERKRVALVDRFTPYKRGKGYEGDCPERDANARLIAAAPDLLEALKDLHGWLLAAGDMIELGAEPRQALSKAAAALAKANGEGSR